MSNALPFQHYDPYRTPVVCTDISKHPLHQIATLLNKLELCDKSHNVFMILTAMTSSIGPTGTWSIT